MNIAELLKEIIACMTEKAEQDGRLHEAIKTATLEERVDAVEAKAPVIELPEAPAFGDQAESYTLTFPSYENLGKSYTMDYTSLGVEMNDKATQASYEAEVREEEFYEAAMTVLEEKRQADKYGQTTNEFEQPLAVREKARLFKHLNWDKWCMMYDHPEIKFA